jgi:hypothetical protein
VVRRMWMNDLDLVKRSSDPWEEADNQSVAGDGIHGWAHRSVDVCFYWVTAEAHFTFLCQ